MNGTIARALVKPIGRLTFELLMWMPVWLLLTIDRTAGARAAWLAAAAGCWIVGVLIAQLRPPWRLLAVLASMLAVVAATIAIDYREYLPFGAWLATLAWRGRYTETTPGQYGIAFLIAAAGVVYASNADKAADYRMGFIALAIVWAAGLLIAMNRVSVHEAGLRSAIVTRAVRRDSRKYAIAFVAIGLIVFGLTVSYGQQWLRLPHVNLESSGPTIPEPPAAPPEDAGPPLPPLGEYRSSPIWDILSYVVGGLAACGLAWFAYWMWRERTWSWKAWKDALRRLFLRDRKEEKLPYVEERRSLPKTKRKAPWSDLFHRPRRGPDWHRLNNAQKVRRLYADAVASGIATGYAHEAHRTAAETMGELERLRVARSGGDDGRQAAYWSWFSNVRQALLRLYEQARYSQHEVREQEVAALTERHPDREKL
ncbi:hypothetical protein [Cohnella sp. GCM10027633]|uniref:hypothetical protein n=1 Tax=unclassified Cohnella TaxID=2636738 RepID=UPI0036432C17